MQFQQTRKYQASQKSTHEIRSYEREGVRKCLNVWPTVSHLSSPTQGPKWHGNCARAFLALIITCHTVWCTTKRTTVCLIMNARTSYYWQQIKYSGVPTSDKYTIELCYFLKAGSLPKSCNKWHVRYIAGPPAAVRMVILKRLYVLCVFHRKTSAGVSQNLKSDYCPVTKRWREMLQPQNVMWWEMLTKNKAQKSLHRKRNSRAPVVRNTSYS